MNILLNIVIFFIIPWIFGICLYKNYNRIVLTISPITGLISAKFNKIANVMDWWALFPFDVSRHVTTIPPCLGLYPVAASFLIYFIHKKGKNPVFAVFLWSLALTSLEGIAVSTGYEIYGHRWNLGGTFLSYILAFSLVYGYYRWLKHIGIFG